MMKMMVALFSVVVVLLFTALPKARAADAPKSTATCVGCHGPAGVSANDPWPNLAGQKKEYLVLQLNAFKSGERVNTLMSPIAKMLSDADITELAAYYSSLGAKAAE